MSRFRELLREANAKLDLPQPERSRILLEIAADMEDLYALYRERGASEEEAVARTVEKFALSDEALADLVRVHRTALQRLLGGVSDQARTRSQRIGTFADVPIDAAIIDAAAPPVYQQIAPKAVQLQQLGMSNSAIARRLGVTDKTVTKAVEWLLNRKCEQGQ